MLQESAVKLWQEMQNVTSPLQPYMRVLPDRAHVSSYYDIPVSYLPLIQNTAMVGGCSGAVHVDMYARALQTLVVQPKHLFLEGDSEG